MVWAPVTARLPLLTGVALPGDGVALGGVVLVPVLEPVELPVPLLVPADEPVPELPVGDEEPEPVDAEPPGPEATGTGLNGSTPGVAEAAAPVDRRTTATRATAAIDLPSTLSAFIATILRATPVKSASLPSGMRNGGWGLPLKFPVARCR
jgi:hypothetical protein